MKLPSPTASAIFVSLLLLGHICAAQTSPPPANPASFPVPAETTAAPPAPVAGKVDKDSDKPKTDKPAATPATETAEPAAASATPKSAPRASGHADSEPKPEGKKPYVIGPLDVLEIKVWDAKELSGFFPVSADGMISVPLIGDIKADGLTKDQLTQVLRDRLAEKVFAQTPELNEVNVQVAKINSKKVTVYGGVARTGPVPLDGDMTIMDVLALVLPFKEFAKPKGIYIMRGDQKLKFSYPDFIKGKNMKQNILLENGDRIIVPES